MGLVEELARARFDSLTDAELRLLRSAAGGTTAYCGPIDQDDHPDNNPAMAESWGVERRIRAELIRWLCVNKEAKAQVDARGVRAHGASIQGRLDLAVAFVPFPLELRRYSLSDEADLSFIDIPAIDFTGTTMFSFQANHAAIKGNTTLRCLRAKGRVELKSIRIGGDVLFQGANLQNPQQTGNSSSGVALDLAFARIAGDVFLSDGFLAEGRVRLKGAETGGNLDCEGGKFLNPAQANVNQSGTALAAVNAKVEGDVFLHNGFVACGQRQGDKAMPLLLKSGRAGFVSVQPRGSFDWTRQLAYIQ